MGGTPPGPLGTYPVQIHKCILARTESQPPVPLGIPLVERAPENAISIKQFIALVAMVEARYTPKEQRNTKSMITRIRKIFYGKESWNKHLIEGAKNIPGPYATSQVEKSRFTIEFDWTPDLSVVGKEYTVIDLATGRSPKIAKNQEVRLTSGSYIDVGHVFAGLDASNFPQTVPQMIGPANGPNWPADVIVDKNVDAVTWVGDLGSVLAEVQLKGWHKKKTPTDAELQAVINEYASARDMLGNIDSYVIGVTYEDDVRKRSEGMKVSEILRKFYLSGPDTDGTQAREHRYSIFAEQIGLVAWDGSKFVNEDKWSDYYADEVSDAAGLYVGVNTRGLSKYGWAVVMSMNNEGAKKLVMLFLQALKTRIRSEPQR